MRSTHPLSMWVVTLALAFGERAGLAEVPPGHEEGPAEYIVRTVATDAANREQFVACLSNNELPFWRRLHSQGKVAAASVFETEHVLTSQVGIPAWNFLLIVHVAGHFNSREVMNLFDSHFAGDRRCDVVARASLMRHEFMRTAPNSNYARDGQVSDQMIRRAKAEYIVEYIAVRETAEDLARYRSIMRDSVGPAMQMLIREGWQLSFVALETEEVRYSAPGMTSWNQLHVGLYPTKGSDEEQEAAEDQALKSVNPNSGGFKGVYGPLPSYRTKPREDRVRQLRELSVN